MVFYRKREKGKSHLDDPFDVQSKAVFRNAEKVALLFWFIEAFRSV